MSEECDSNAGTGGERDAAATGDAAAQDQAMEGGEGPDDDHKPKRLCRYPGCSRVIKSQGHCQRHGAKAKRCRIEDCEKQAQGTHDGMCKRHWKAIHFPEAVPEKEDEDQPEPKGESVYDSILPHSISYRPVGTGGGKLKEDGTAESATSSQLSASARVSKAAAAAAIVAAASASVAAGRKDGHGRPAAASGAADGVDPWDCPPAPDGVCVMPLVKFLQDGAHKEIGWHRNNERRARGMLLVSSLSCQLEPWERQLALVEILLLSGGTPYANFKDLAHAWGREKGFHHILASAICERRGAVERKRRSDAGKRLSAEEREIFRQKLKRARTRGEPVERAEAAAAARDDDGDDGEEKKVEAKSNGRAYL